jgi:protein SCO1/2
MNDMDRRLLLAMAGGLAYGAADKLIASPQRTPSPHPYFPDFFLINQAGKAQRLYSDLLKNKIVVINMMYAVCTGICPDNTARLREVQAKLGERSGRDVFIYSITLRPEADSPAVLADYARQYGITQGWSFLTGSPHNVDVARRKLGFYDTDPVADADIANHTGILRIGNVARDRWMMMPNRSRTELVVRAIDNIC